MFTCFPRSSGNSIRAWLLALWAIVFLSVTHRAWAETVQDSFRSEDQGEVLTPAAPLTEQIKADWLRQDELRGVPDGTTPGKMTREIDASGAVDGVIDGTWGFHTEIEENPWWQVDLGGPVELGRVVLYNRCDGTGSRNQRIIVLLSDEGKDFRQAYQHDGADFRGHSDDKPLEVDLAGQRTRFVRLQLPGRSYFHLDEVQVYPAGKEENLALGKPATQSSLSQWSKGPRPGAAGQDRVYHTGRVIARGLKLAEKLRPLGADVDDQVRELTRVKEHLDQLSEDATDNRRRALYFQARWAVRRMALRNPLLDFDSILFTKRIPPGFPHMSDEYYGWWSRGGGGLYLLDGFKTDSPRLRPLTEDWDVGSFIRPDLSFDGRRMLFAYAKYYPEVHQVADKVNKDNLPEDSFYQVYELMLDGSGFRRLTRGKYDSFDARYLPNGDIAFLSTRKGRSVQVTPCTARATLEAPDLPDSFVRCGGDNRRPVAVFTLHRMSPDGSNLLPISAFENFEWTPLVAADGRILYARWDYIDRFNQSFMSLWSKSPDGTNPQLVYGNYTKLLDCVFEAQPVPGSHKLMFTASAHHSNLGGSIVLLDRTRGTEGEGPLRRLTPEVCFPESEGWPRHYYLNPHPLSEDFFLVAWSDAPLPRHTLLMDPENNPIASMGVYLADSLGNLELLYRDPGISSLTPLPVRPRPRPPVIAESPKWDGPQEGRYLLQDVYRGMEGLPRGTIRSLRVVAVPPKVQPHMNQPVLGVSREDPGKYVLGTAPVAEDGSAHFRVPSGVPVLFQALDAEGFAVQTMRSLTYVQPGQTLSCIGCHEHRDLSPSVGSLPLAAREEPSRLRPGPEGSWPLRYDQLVQPVLDRHCVSCHRPDSDEKEAAAFDLTPARSYESLLHYADDDLKNLAFERDRSFVGECVAQNSKLMALLLAGHHDVRLDAESLERLTTWMDTYAHRQGHFSPEQEGELHRLKADLAEMLSPR